jgi:speckle-type POZ protein
MLLEKLVQFFYSLDYSDEVPEDSGLSPLQLHAKMFGLADEYIIPELLPVAASKYSAWCLESWEPLVFLTSIPDVYDAAPALVPLLRHTACMAIRKELPEMLEEEAVAERYRKTVAENPEFATDLLQSYIEGPLYWHCSSCNSHQYITVTRYCYNQCQGCEARC